MGRAIHLLFSWVGFEQCFFLISGSSLLKDNGVTVLYLYWTFTYLWRSKSSQQIFCSAVFFLLICRCFRILVGVPSGLDRLGNVMFWCLWEVEDFHFNAVFCNCFLVVYMCMWTEVSCAHESCRPGLGIAPQPSTLLFDAGLSGAGEGCWVSQADGLSLPPQGWIVSEHHHDGFLHRLLGTELRSSRLHSRPYNDWAIFPAPFFLLWKCFLLLLFKQCLPTLPTDPEVFYSLEDLMMFYDWYLYEIITISL